jgi:urease accessory protein
MASTEPKRVKLDSDTTIVTHNGTHHADEALAVNLLRKLPQYATATLQRSRDKSIIDQASIVVDVGAEYDAARHRYDHHQRGFEETFDKDHKIKLSSAGLVWK